MRTRKDAKNDIMDWEELEQAPNVRGAYSFLAPSSRVVSIRRDHEPRAKQDLYLASRRDVMNTADGTATVDETSTVSPQPGKSRHPRKVYSCRLVQHGHSQGERILYDELWKLGSGESQEYREVTIGWDRMGSIAEMSDKAAKRNLTSLIDKLAVEMVKEHDSTRRIGRTYRVFSFTKILERRRSAGLLYVVRDKGVRFVTADGHPLPVRHAGSTNPEGRVPTGDVLSTVDEISTVTVDETSSVSVDRTSRVTVDETSPPLGKYLGKSLGNTSSTSEDVEQVLAALSAYATADRDAAERMMRSCRTTCPDVQGGEVAALIHEKAAIMKGRRDVANPVGFLLSAVPRCCEPQTLAELRMRAQVAAEAERQRLAMAEEREQEEIVYFRRLHREYLAQLNDPGSTALQIERAKQGVAATERWLRDVGVSTVE